MTSPAPDAAAAEGGQTKSLGGFYFARKHRGRQSCQQNCIQIWPAFIHSVISCTHAREYFVPRCFFKANLI